MSSKISVRSDIDKVREAGALIAEIVAEDLLPSQVKKVKASINNKITAKKIKIEYNDLVDFNKNNCGYEDYILFVSELFEDNMELERNKYIELINKSHSFNSSTMIKGEYIVDDIDNDFINEMFSKRNMDLLLLATKDNSIEENLKKKLTSLEHGVYSGLLRTDPLKALSVLTNGSKNKKIKIKYGEDDLLKAVRSNDKVELINKNFSSVTNFISEKQENSEDSILNGMYIRRKITPLGSLPVKIIINKSKEAISNFRELVKPELEYSFMDKRDIVSINKEIGTDILKTAKTKSDFINRIKKFKNSILAGITIATALFMPSQLITKDDVLDNMLKQELVQNMVEIDSYVIKHKISEGETLSQIARNMLSLSNPNFKEKDVHALVLDIAEENPVKLSNPDLLTIGDVIKVKVKR